MLRSKDSPDGCPQLMFQSVALSVLSCFTGEEEIMTNASVLFNLPVLMDIINDSDNEIYEENLLIINDAYEILTAIASTEKGKEGSHIPPTWTLLFHISFFFFLGRQSFISNRGIHHLIEIQLKQSFQCERASELFLALLVTGGQHCWSYHTGPEDFNRIMMKYCTEFAETQEELKFELCDSLRTIIRRYF